MEDPASRPEGRRECEACGRFPCIPGNAILMRICRSTAVVRHVPMIEQCKWLLMLISQMRRRLFSRIPSASNRRFVLVTFAPDLTELVVL